MASRKLTLVAVLLASATVLAAPLMYKGQTVIDIPKPGEPVPLSGLSYKSHAFEAAITSVKLEPKSDNPPDVLRGRWTFLGSNNDGQMHKVEITTRLLDPSGKQIAMHSGKCILAAGSHDQPCVVEIDIKADDWKSAKSVRIVADFNS